MWNSGMSKNLLEILGDWERLVSPLNLWVEIGLVRLLISTAAAEGQVDSDIAPSWGLMLASHSESAELAGFDGFLHGYNTLRSMLSSSYGDVMMSWAPIILLITLIMLDWPVDAAAIGTLMAAFAHFIEIITCVSVLIRQLIRLGQWWYLERSGMRWLYYRQMPWVVLRHEVSLGLDARLGAHGLLISFEEKVAFCLGVLVESGRCRWHLWLITLILKDIWGPMFFLEGIPFVLC